MSIAKVITIIGSSPESFAKAADAAVQEAGKTLRGIHGAHVVSMSATVERDRGIVAVRAPAVEQLSRPAGHPVGQPQVGARVPDLVHLAGPAPGPAGRARDAAGIDSFRGELRLETVRARDRE